MATRTHIQKPSSSWTPAANQIKGFIGPHPFPDLAKPNSQSVSSKEIPAYSSKTADRLHANVMRTLQAKTQEEANLSPMPEKGQEELDSSHSLKQGQKSTTSSPTKGQGNPFSLCPIMQKAAAMTVQRLCSECEQEREGQQEEEKKSSRIGLIQTKLTISEPGDKYEQEADRVGKQVVQRINAPETSAFPFEPGKTLQKQPMISVLQRMRESEKQIQLQHEQTMLQGPSEFWQRIARQAVKASVPNVKADFETRLNRAKGGGSPLDNAFRAKIEPAMGADFTGVKVHTDAEADQLSQSIQAKAFTTGQDIFFRQGTYEPRSQQGQELLAHELIHVVQQKYARNQYQLQSRPVETRVQAKPQESLPQKGTFPKNSPWNRVWIGLPGIIGEVVEAGVTVRIFKSYKELGVRQKPEDRAYACGRYNVSAIQMVVNKMKLIAQKVAYFNKKILKSKMQTTLVLIDPGAAATGFRLSKGKGLIILNQKDFNKGAYLDYIAHEAGHAIFASHSEEHKKPSQRVPDSLALHIADLYVQLKKTKKVSVPSKKFTKQKPSLKLENNGKPVGLVMVVDTLWSGQGGHPWHGVDEFFASAYAGFLQQPKLLHQIVNHYKKTEPAIKPLANKLFKLLKMVGKPEELKKLNKPSQSQAAQKELTGTGTIPRLDEIIGGNLNLLWLDNPSKMPLGSQSCPSKLPQKSSRIPEELQLSSTSRTTDTTVQMLAEQTLVADGVKHAVQWPTFFEGSTLIQRSGAVKQEQRITPVTPYYVSFVNAKIPEKPNHSFSFSSRKGANRAGLTQVKVQKKLKFFWDHGAARPDGKVPFFARSVNIFFRLDPIKIYVSSDYAEGSCPYRATLEHEKVHVKSFIKIFHSYRDKLIKEINSISFPTEASPLWSDPGNLSTIQTSLEKLVVQAIKDIANKLNADMRKDRAAKDSPSAYKAVYTQCPTNEWNPKKEGNNLQMKLTVQPAFDSGATATPDLEVSMNQTQGSRNLLAGVQQVEREGAIYLQQQKTIQRSKETLTQEEKHTAVKYLVEALAQPTWWTCFQTCLVMLHRYQSQGSGIFHHPSELEAMMYPNSKKKKHKIKPEANLYLLDPNNTYRGRKPSELLTSPQAHELVKRFGFKSTAISPSPQAFLDILQQYGPFIWVGNYEHTVVITGLEKKKDNFYVHYNDPNGGQKNYKEFYEFLINLMPSMGQIGSQKSFVFHI